MPGRPAWNRGVTHFDQWPFQEPMKIGGTYTIYLLAYEFQTKISGNFPTKYGLKYGTNVPPFEDPEIPIDGS